MTLALFDAVATTAYQSISAFSLPQVTAVKNKK